MEIRSTSCCAVSDIDGLSGHENARQAMLAFCSEELGGKLGGFYIFTAVVREPGRRPTYGPNFKNYIIKNKLGTVTESPAEANRRNHPSHYVKVYVWHPDQKRLEAWWKKNKKDYEDEDGYRPDYWGRGW